MADNVTKKQNMHIRSAFSKQEGLTYCQMNAQNARAEIPRATPAVRDAAPVSVTSQSGVVPMAECSSDLNLAKVKTAVLVTCSCYQHRTLSPLE